MTGQPVPDADADADARGLRVAVAFPGDVLDPAAWSGTPAGVVAGLTALGVEVVPIRARPSAAVDRRLRQALAVPRLHPRGIREQGWRHELGLAKGEVLLSPAYGAWGGRLGQVALDRHDPVAAVVQLGTSFRLLHPRLVTYEDLTIPQVLGRPFFGWERLSARAVQRRMAMQRAAYDAAVACCAATPWTAASIRDDYGVAPDKIHAVGIGANRVLSEAAGGRDWSRPRFLFIGKDWIDKNGPALLAAFAQVHAARPDATLDLVGNHPPVEQPGVTGHGFVPLGTPEGQALFDSLLARSTCLVVPTSFEPAGIAYVEAAAAGLPSIGTSAGGAADIIGAGGRVVDPTDVAALTAAMLALAEPRAARAAGAVAAERAALMTWQRVAGRLLQAAGVLPRQDADWAGLF